MVSTLVRVLSVEQVLLPGRKERTQMRLAEHTLRSIDYSQLTVLEHLILGTLVAVKEQMRLQDIRHFRVHPIEAVHDAWAKLADLFLIQQQGELMFLHTFIEEYFRAALGQRVTF
jgi:hypothetical protein